MPEPAMRSDLGRCPACQQLVTVPAEGRSLSPGVSRAPLELACPSCQHRAPAAAFTLEAPRAAIVLPAGSGARPGPRAPSADPDRTHLLLDIAPDADDEREDEDEDTPARGVPQPRAGSAIADPDRTHLLLDAADLKDDEAPAPRRPRPRRTPDVPRAQPAAASERRPAVADASDDERTHLLLGPLSVRPEDSTPFARVLAALNRLVPPTLRLSVRLDEALHGRWLWALGGVGALCGLIAPGVDYIATRGSATVALFTWLCCTSALGLLGISQLNTLRDDAGHWDPRLALLRVQAGFRLLVDGFEHFDSSPRHLRFALIGQVLALIGLGGFAWAASVAGLRWLIGLDAAASSLPVLSGLLLLGGVGSLVQSARTTPRPGLFLQDFGNCLAAALELPAIVDLSEPLPEAFARGNTALHECVLALVKWRARSWPDEAAYRAALALHLQRQLPGARIERERWMGASRLDGVLDLVVNGMIVIGVQRGFDAASAERAIGQMSGYARAWSGKPMLLAVFEAPRETLQGSAQAAPLLAAHQEFALLTLRMPLN